MLCDFPYWESYVYGRMGKGRVNDCLKHQEGEKNGSVAASASKFPIILGHMNSSEIIV
jgi:hypothetical protein